jgi:peptide deformylase
VILPVVHLPHTVLRKPASAVRPDDRHLQRLIDDMLETMDHHPRCVGLAAPQVGKSLRVIVVDASRTAKPQPGSHLGRMALINPSIIHRSQPKLLREGCLSVPDFTGNVIRDQEVELSAQDRQGNPVTLRAHGFEAVVFQHEVDHLDGKLFLDRVASLQTDVFRRKNYG